MKHQKILFLIYLISLSSLSWGNIFENRNMIQNDFLTSTQKSSDKVGNPLESQSLGDNLYVENILAEISQDTSVIHHSRVSNSRNMFGLDLLEPCFSNASFYLSFTNELQNPIPLSTFSYGKNAPSVSKFGFLGFLVYETSYSANVVASLRDRVVKLFETKFELNIIELQNVTDENIYFFPFYGLISNFSQFTENVLGSISTEGYFNPSFLNQPLNTSISSSNFVQESLFYFHSPTTINVITHFWEKHYESLNFDIYTPLNRIPLLSLVNDFSEMEGNSADRALVSAEVDNLILDQNIDDLINFPFHILQVSYTGNSEGIKTKNGEYIFNFRKALGLPDNFPIELSTECLNSLFGLFSGISIVCAHSDILEVSPQKFNISSENIVPLQHFLYLASNGADISLNFRDYQWNVLFESQGSISQLKTLPKKVQNLAPNLEDFFDLFSPFALSFLPCLFFDSVPDFYMKYKLKENPTLIKIQKEMISLNHSEPFFFDNQTVNFTLKVKNLCNSDVWGLPMPDLSSFGINNLSPDNSISNRLEVLGYNTKSMFSSDIPRFFSIDLLGQGYFSQIFPNILNESVRSRYSPAFTASILDNLADLTVHTSYNESQLVEYAQSFNYSYSMYNPLNWVIQPNSTLNFFSQITLDTGNSTFLTNDPATFRYGSEHGYEFHDIRSNSLAIFLNSSTSIKATARLVQNFTRSGYQNSYIVSLHHSGNKNFTNIKINVSIVGILIDSGDFDRNGKILSLNIPYFNASTLQTEFSYTFFSPNSLIIRSTKVWWEDESYQRILLSNEVEMFVEPYFDDKLHLPFIPQLSLDTSISIHNKSILLVNCTMMNVGDSNITNVNLLPLFPSDSYILTNITQNSNISLLTPLETYTTVFIFEIIFPYAILSPLIWMNGLDSYLYHFSSCISHPLGSPNITISKILNRIQGWTGQNVVVSIKITNFGDIPIQNLVIDDYYGFPIQSMSLDQGVLQKSIFILGVGESFSFNYSLNLEQLGNFELLGAQVRYLYVSQIKITSEIKTLQVRSTFNLIFGLSSSMVIGVSLMFFIIHIKRRSKVHL
ncbi:hypothetical protein NEF87_001663 [Candidatus Lokiarchaeum ossiferum]|uniref:Uncharacterized protein n=1 Tax=Candidatus Lokiarchaeum ossiferum TaxID=2951803 RepID=A0ABY6HPX1_9ARCH|nr:hypothetical protein NEF87_001663 [Candidatus Lokiarchaeum sp. B-35]